MIHLPLLPSIGIKGIHQYCPAISFLWWILRILLSSFHVPFNYKMCSMTNSYTSLSQKSLASSPWHSPLGRMGWELMYVLYFLCMSCLYNVIQVCQCCHKWWSCFLLWLNTVLYEEATFSVSITYGRTLTKSMLSLCRMLGVFLKSCK